MTLKHDTMGANGLTVDWLSRSCRAGWSKGRVSGDDSVLNDGTGFKLSLGKIPIAFSAGSPSRTKFLLNTPILSSTFREGCHWNSLGFSIFFRHQPAKNLHILYTHRLNCTVQNFAAQTTKFRNVFSLLVLLKYCALVSSVIVVFAVSILDAHALELYRRPVVLRSKSSIPPYIVPNAVRRPLRRWRTLDFHILSFYSTPLPSRFSFSVKVRESTNKNFRVRRQNDVWVHFIFWRVLPKSLTCSFLKSKMKIPKHTSCWFWPEFPSSPESSGWLSNSFLMVSIMLSAFAWTLQQNDFVYEQSDQSTQMLVLVCTPRMNFQDWLRADENETKSQKLSGFSQYFFFFHIIPAACLINSSLKKFRWFFRFFEF